MCVEEPSGPCGGGGRQAASRSAWRRTVVFILHPSSFILQKDSSMFVELLKDWKGKPAGERIDVPEDFAPVMSDSGLAQAVAGDPVGEYVARAAEKMTASLNSVLDQTLKQLVEGHARKKAPFPLAAG